MFNVVSGRININIGPVRRFLVILVRVACLSKCQNTDKYLNHNGVTKLIIVFIMITSNIGDCFVPNVPCLFYFVKYKSFNFN